MRRKVGPRSTSPRWMTRPPSASLTSTSWTTASASGQPHAPAAFAGAGAANSSATSAALTARLEHILEPIPHRRGADAGIVDLAVVVAALLPREHAELLATRADRIEATLRQRQRDLLVA